MGTKALDDADTPLRRRQHEDAAHRAIGSAMGATMPVVFHIHEHSPTHACGCINDGKLIGFHEEAGRNAGEGGAQPEGGGGKGDATDDEGEKGASPWRGCHCHPL